MVGEKLRSERAAEKLRDTQKGVLEAYSRGLLSEHQAMAELGLGSYDDLLRQLDHAGLAPWEPSDASLYHKAIGEGFASYWLLQNTK